MKAKLRAASLLLMAALLFAGCGAAEKSASRDNGYDMDAGNGYDSSSSYTAAGSSSGYAAADEYYPYDEPENYLEEQKSNGDISGILDSAAGTTVSKSEKMIYTAYAELETREFDDTVQGVYDMLGRFGAYIESTYITGRDYASDYYGHTSARSANFTIRVPVQNYSEMASSFSALGNVTSFSSDSQNITSRFVDTEARLKAYETERDRLLEMLASAETVQDMITVESRLSDVEYSIEALTSTLRSWQDQVDYSTINLHVSEVRTFTEKVEEPDSFGEEIVAALKKSVNWLGDTAREGVVLFVGALPLLAVPGVIAVIIIIAVKTRRRKKRARMAAVQQEKKELQ